MDFTRDLSIRKIPGVGRVNERLLESIGIKVSQPPGPPFLMLSYTGVADAFLPPQTCGDIYAYRAVLSVMDKTFGLHGLLRIYLGIGSNVVQPHQREERKSIGAER
jgi:DNA polymerase kappa